MLSHTTIRIELVQRNVAQKAQYFRPIYVYPSHHSNSLALRETYKMKRLVFKKEKASKKAGMRIKKVFYGRSGTLRFTFVNGDGVNKNKRY